MTIVNWYEPIDPWMTRKLGEAIKECAVGDFNKNLVAAVGYTVIENRKKLKFPDKLSMIAIDKLVAKHNLKGSSFFPEMAKSTYKVIFNLSEPFMFNWAICDFMDKVASTAKIIEEENTEDKYEHFPDLLFKLRGRLNLL